MKDKELLQIIEQAIKDGVTELNLRGLQLSQLPPEIGQLSHLRTLIFHENPLRELPPEIGHLTNLQRLVLQFTQLRELPPEIGQLINLQQLDLRSNQLRQLPSEIRHLSNLQQLNLSYNQLSELPLENRHLSNLQQLDLRGNQLRELPPEIGHLINLQQLDLSYNQLREFPAQISHLTNLTALNLNYNRLHVVPLEIGQLTNLTELSLSGNQLSMLPPEIGHLTNLTRLDLGGGLHRFLGLYQDRTFRYMATYQPGVGNQLSMLPSEIGHLTNLKQLDLGFNQLRMLPPEIGHLSNLTILYLDSNQFSTFPPEIAHLTNLTSLDLRGNLLPIPHQVLAGVDKPATIIEYYLRARQEGVRLNEAKLVLVGQGNVGKTSLVKRLALGEFDKEEPSTEGINIKQSIVTSNYEHIKLNIWDFGGQEIMHATHQFFLTKRTLYLVMLDVRLGEIGSRLDYWLKIVHSFGGDSPIIVVSNKVDQFPYQLALNQRELIEKYPTIKAFVNTSCKTEHGITDLKRKIGLLVEELKDLPDLIPFAWLEIKTELERMEKDYISYNDYVRLCQAKNITDEKEQRTLIQLLHDLGVVLSFQDDPRLSETSVLNPEWVTGGVYSIITAKIVEQSQGILKIEQLDDILDSQTYPRERHWFIIDIMRKFELCFELEGHSDQIFLIPDLLPKEEPELDWPRGGHLHFEYHYDFLPSSIISRFIVRMHRFIFRENYWLNGVVLVNKSARALVRALPNDNKITITMIGATQERRELLQRLRDQLEDIHQSFANLKPIAKIPVLGDVIEYDHLRSLQKYGWDIAPVWLNRQLVEVNVRELLAGIRPAPKSDKQKEAARSLENYLEHLRRRMHPEKYHLKLLSLAESHYEWGEYTLARQALLAVHEAIVDLRGMVTQDAAQVELSEKSVGLYEMLVHCYLQEGQESKAFEYAAIGKGRAFVKKLAEVRFDLEVIEGSHQTFTQKLQEARQLRRQIEALESKSSSDEVDQHSQQYLLLRRETDLWREMANEYPVLTATLSVPTLSAAQAKDLAQALDATLVEYDRHMGGWCAFVVTADQIRYVPLPALSNQLLEQMIEWRNDVHLPAGRSSWRHKRLAELHSAAIAPLALEGERIIIAPFERLHLLPLAAAYNRGTKRYLVQDHLLSFVPSLTVLHLFHQEQKRQTSKESIKQLLSVAYPGPPENYLPHVLHEAKAIVERVSKVAQVDELHEEQATPSNVLQKAPSYDVIHFGCHGRFDSDKPTESGILLAGHKPYLTVQDIITSLNLKRSRLVTLAACLSGQVALREGEEHIGLLQAMMTAGVPTVVASLWSVDDAATRALFTAFYTKQIHINAPAQAMREATVLLRMKERWSHPYYWAAFQVNGLSEPYEGVTQVQWANDLLEQINEDYRQSIKRGASVNEKLFVDNAQVLFKDMLSDQESLQALKQHQLSDEIAGLRVENNELGIADAIHHIVINNTVLRDRFLPPSEREVKQLRAQLRKLRLRVSKEQHETTAKSLHSQGEAGQQHNDVVTVKQHLVQFLEGPPSSSSNENDKQNESPWNRFVAMLLRGKK